MHMIYLTGDTHKEFQRFTKNNLQHLPFTLTEQDYVIVCGDFGLLWSKDKEFEYNCDWLSRLPFPILWVQGNHENYNMIKEYPLEEWNGGKVRHIVRNKIILLERGQVFDIDGHRFFTFGGAKTHDTQGGILDPDSPNYKQEEKEAKRSNLPYRIKNVSWWEQELPSAEEMEEGLHNLEKVNFTVDYVVTHCASNSTQRKIEAQYNPLFHHTLTSDVLTDYFEELEKRLHYKHWYCGHYHDDVVVDEKHTVLYLTMVPLE